MKRFFRKIKVFLIDSNHYKHLIGGFVVGMFGVNPWSSFYADTIAAWCLEVKDAAYGTNGTGQTGR